MNTKLKELDGLLREISVELPATDFLRAVKEEISNIAKTAKINGFRLGKIPTAFIEKKYGTNIKAELAQKTISKVLPQVFTQENLQPAATPDLTKLDVDDPEFLKFTVQFEVFPSIKLKPVSGLSFEQISCEINEADVDQALEDLRKQKAQYTSASRVAKVGDKVNIDFNGSIDGTAFEGGKASDFELILGDKKMIAGFEEGIIGRKVGDTFTLKLTFPKDYQAQNLAQKLANFDIIINDVLSPKLPELDQDLANQYQEESLEALKKSTRKYMQTELDKRLISSNKVLIFDALLDANPVEVPDSSIKEESKKMLADMKKSMGGQATKQTLDPSMFENQAKRSLQLGFLFAELGREANIVPSADDVKNKIIEIAKEHQQPEAKLMSWYHEDASRLAGIQGGLLEELVLSHLIKSAEVTIIRKNFKEFIYNT